MRLILIVLLLAGCATPEQRAAYQQREAERQAQAMIVSYGPICEKLGLVPKSEAWANCVVQQAQLQASRDGAAAAGFGALQQMRPKTCYPVGNRVTCY